ncbi:hypothetical protein TWF481_010006 [Arthrobotrys musiformis]|uniref:DNA polymerase epsilon subunit D n=1 Tax=Arthrobotrys musiformis TaxID=47236 RepID=A0AAV9W1X3_9PEZI
MPPRKSDAGKTAAAAPASSSESDKPKARTKTSVDDNTLPKSIVTKLAKGNIPSNTQIQKDAVTALSRGATVFINYFAALANDITKAKGRKTIVPDHILEAVDQIEIPGLKQRLLGELEKFNETQTNKRKKAKDKKTEDSTIVVAADPMSEDESARPLKRQRKFKSIADQKDDEDDGAVTEGNILEDGSQDEEEEEEEEEAGEEDEESSDGESGDEEPEDGMEDTVEDIDRDDGMDEDEDDEALDDGSDSD